jgi:uncharacterized protein YbjT (DUF2867 family)
MPSGKPILVTGAAGRMGSIGRMLTEYLIERGETVRALVRTDDERAEALRRLGAEVMVGNLLDLETMHRAVEGCDSMYFSMSVADSYLAATVNAAAVAKHHGVKAFVNISQMSVAQMSVFETTPSPQHKLHWLAEQALQWSGLPVVNVRPTVFVENFFLRFAAPSVKQHNEIRLPFGDGKTSPIAADDVARSLAAILVDPAPHIGATYHLTGPESADMRYFASEYSAALGRTIDYRDIPVEPWRETLVQRGMAPHLIAHLSAMADLHRAGRYNRMTSDVSDLTGQKPASVREFVRRHADAFTLDPTREGQS